MSCSSGEIVISSASAIFELWKNKLFCYAEKLDLRSKYLEYSGQRGPRPENSK